QDPATVHFSLGQEPAGAGVPALDIPARKARNSLNRNMVRRRRMVIRQIVACASSLVPTSQSWMKAERLVRRKSYVQKAWQPGGWKKKQRDFGRERRSHIALTPQPSMRMLSASVQSASRRKLEVHPARIILLHCGLKVKLGERNLSSASVT